MWGAGGGKGKKDGDEGLLPGAGPWGPVCLSLIFWDAAPASLPPREAGREQGLLSCRGGSGAAPGWASQMGEFGGVGSVLLVPQCMG